MNSYFRPCDEIRISELAKSLGVWSTTLTEKLSGTGIKPFKKSPNLDNAWYVLASDIPEVEKLVKEFFRKESSFSFRQKSPIEKILSQIEKNETGCWLWTGRVNNNGYGVISISSKENYTHRVSYTELKGPIPIGLFLDHLCRTPRCCNPDHLEPVTHKENMARGITANKTHCVNGHPFTPENTYFRPDNGTRQCKACCSERDKRRKRGAK
jgi:hypothetical protein